MDDYRAELATVTQELSGIEAELDELLEKQAELLDRKKELETILSQSASRSPTQNIQWDKTDFKWSSELQKKLEDVFGIKLLRPMQLQTMNVTMSGKDCVLIMPTGGGKSLCFQLPALLSTGITLVVSPLVSLMEDQVMALHGYSIDATMLNASTPKEDLKQVQQAMVDKNATLKLLYVTPEKLAKSKRFMAQLEKAYKAGRFARLVIDEVHCCSQWGHDFRPDYKFLGIMKRQFPDVPILGLTATATSGVLDDVKKILNIQNCQLFRASFNRPNLFYEVREKPSVQKEVMEDIQMLISSRFPNQSGIIYTFSKRESEEVTADLQSRGIKAGCYHADLSARERSRIHKAWIDNRVHVVVATVAFGMGIDKPDVRYVIHHSLSKSMENLYQESGRAGRDDKKSHCIIYYRLQDVFRQSCMVMAEQTGVRNLYGIMEYCVDNSKCRRSVIAKYFGEVWERSQCNKMCDHCSSNFEVEKKDVTSYCTNVLKIVDSANVTDQKLTANKLLDAWQGKGPTFLRVKGTDTGTDRQKLEIILATLLLKEYLKEDFHFTPYSTISYLVPGRKAVRLRNGMEKIFIELPGKVKKDSGASSSSSSQNLTASGGKVKNLTASAGKVKNITASDLASKNTNPSLKKSKSETDRPKLVVINTEKSAFTQILRTENSIDDDPPKVKKTKSVIKKRKPLIVESDSDSDSLDFGDSCGRSKGKKRKRSLENSHISNGDTGKSSCAMLDRQSSNDKVSNKTPVIIDSDSDDDGNVDGSGKNDTENNSWTEQDTTAAISVLDSDSDFDE